MTSTFNLRKKHTDLLTKEFTGSTSSAKDRIRYCMECDGDIKIQASKLLESAEEATGRKLRFFLREGDNCYKLTSVGVRDGCFRLKARDNVDYPKYSKTIDVFYIPEYADILPEQWYIMDLILQSRKPCLTLSKESGKSITPIFIDSVITVRIRGNGTIFIKCSNRELELVILDVTEE